MFRKSHKSRPSPKNAITTAPPRYRGRRLKHGAQKTWVNSIKPWLRWISSLLGRPFRQIELISAISKKCELQSEIPKAVYGLSRWDVIGSCAIQLLAITAMAVLVIYLNFSKTYWESVRGGTPQNARLNALQFAAKMHEILIVASLSAIVLHYAHNTSSCVVVESHSGVCSLAFKSVMLIRFGVPVFGLQLSLSVKQNGISY